MQKELQNTLSQITMFSKMGRYISNKILKYNKKAKTAQKNYLRNSPPKQQYLRIKKPAENKSAKLSAHQESDKMYMTQPPVGYYKVNHSQVEKNIRTYNFNRSVPHFCREKFHCNQSKPVVKDFPDLSTCKPYTKGLISLKRIASRQNIKGSIRKTIENPHEKRFQPLNDLKSIEKGKKSINMQKLLSRDNKMFKNSQFAPQYDLTKDYNPHRLDTHIIEFERMSPRDQNHMILKSGISDFFNQAENKENLKCMDWKKILPREKTGLLPSYMDKNINTRSSINLLNLKTLEMNSTDLKKIPLKIQNKQKKQMRFIEENHLGKQNCVRNSVR